MHAGLLAPSGERGEIHVGSEVLLAGRLVGVRADGVMAIRHERAAESTGELLVACVTVINDNDEQRAASDGAHDLLDPILREHGHFDALAAFGMDAVAVEEFQLLGERREPGFAQAIVFERGVEFTLCAENLDR